MRAAPGLGSLLLIATLSASLLAQEVEDERATTEQLEALRAEIAEVQARIGEQTAARSDLQSELKATELQIAANDRALAKVQRAIDAALAALEALEREAAILQSDREQLQVTLDDELRNLWALQQGGGLRVLLGDQGPDRTARNLAYYQLLAGARSASIDRYQTLLADIYRNREQRLATRRQLDTERETLTKEQAAATALQRQRQTTLAAIDQALDADNARVAQLEADSARLTELLDALRESLADLDTPASYKPFSDARGELTFPVNGQPNNRFNGARNAGKLRWRGWLIPAAEGDEVRAIHHGRVVYSDWLRGQGLLTILDHGDGWLSLYGHNRSLQAEVGDWVRPGEVIARVGASGGASMPALYFEIRKDGEPVDPAAWLNR